MIVLSYDTGKSYDDHKNVWGFFLICPFCFVTVARQDYDECENGFRNANLDIVETAHLVT